MAEHSFELHIPPRASDGAVAVVDGAPIPLVASAKIELEGGKPGKYVVGLEIHPDHEVHLALASVGVTVNLVGTSAAARELKTARDALSRLWEMHDFAGGRYDDELAAIRAPIARAQGALEDAELHTGD